MHRKKTLYYYYIIIINESLQNKLNTGTTKNHSDTMRLKKYLEIGSVNPSQNVHLSIVFLQVR